MKYNKYIENVLQEEKRIEDTTETRVDSDYLEIHVKVFVLSVLEEVLPQIRTQLIVTPQVEAGLAEIVSKASQENEFYRCHNIVTWRSLKTKPYFQEFVEKIRLFLSPPVKLYKAKKDDFIGLVFQTEMQRNFFIYLLGGLLQTFSAAQKTQAQERFDPGFPH